MTVTTSELDPSGSMSSSLLIRLIASDTGAWRRFVTVFGPLVYAWCRRAGLARSDAEDVGQEVLQIVSKRLPTFRREGSFRGWLWRITHRRIVDLYRARKHEPPGLGGSDHARNLAEIAAADLDDSRPPDLPSDRIAERLRALEAIRGEFEPSTWQAFWRSAIDGVAAAEVAAELGWPDPAASGAKRVRQAKYRVLKRLRQEFGDLLGSLVD
jgi:RNA polymerase sigma-70 factor, ECF subfamily